MGTVIDLKQRQVSLDAEKFRLLQAEFWLDLFTYAEGHPPESTEELVGWTSMHRHPAHGGGSLPASPAEELAKHIDQNSRRIPAANPWDALFQGWLMHRTLREQEDES